MHNLHIDHVTIQSELRYLIGAKAVWLNCRVLGGETGAIPKVRVFYVVKPVVNTVLR
jgi:hypothetical protein